MQAKVDPIAYRLKLLEPSATTIRAPLMLLEEKSSPFVRVLSVKCQTGGFGEQFDVAFSRLLFNVFCKLINALAEIIVGKML